MVCVSFCVICIAERLVSSVICRFQGLSYSHVPECIEFSFILFIHHNIHFYFELCTYKLLWVNEKLHVRHMVSLPEQLSQAKWCNKQHGSLQLCHNEHDGISNHWRLDGLLNCLFRRRSKKTPDLHVTGLCEGSSLVAWIPLTKSKGQ